MQYKQEFGFSLGSDMISSISSWDVIFVVVLKAKHRCLNGLIFWFRSHAHLSSAIVFPSAAATGQVRPDSIKKNKATSNPDLNGESIVPQSSSELIRSATRKLAALKFLTNLLNQVLDAPLKTPTQTAAATHFRHGSIHIALDSIFRRRLPPNIVTTPYRIFSWESPQQCFVKINCDSSFQPQSGVATARGIIRDENGQFMLAFSCALARCSIVKAEALFQSQK
ncbi:hypothetical protein CR513_23327, partial [Mucuna pruriens]